MNETMLAEATIGDLGERDFLREIEDLLRNDQVEDALGRISAPLAGYCHANGALPEALIDLTAADIVIQGWDKLEPRMREIDREGYPVTALGIEIAEPSHDSASQTYPLIETCFYTDSAYPFSECDREALLEGYSSYGTEWQGSSDDCDATIAVSGIHDAYLAVAKLGERLRSPQSEPHDDQRQAYILGACYLAVLIHAAVRKAVDEKGLARPLAVFVAGNGSYPGFDAPVATHFDEMGGNLAGPVHAAAVPSPIADSSQTVSHAEPEAFADDGADRPHDEETRIESHTDQDPLDLTVCDETHPDAQYELPATNDHADHVTGSQLRKRFVTEESIALTQEAEPESLMQRLLGRFKPRS